MAGDRRATMGNLIANRDMEKVFARRRVLRRRHRRHRRPRDRAGQAVPGRARALREDRGHAAVAGGQGQPARLDDPRQPRAWPCRGCRSCRSSPGSTSTRRHRPDLLLRRHRRLLRGARPPQRGVGLAVRPRRAEEAVAPGPAPSTTPCASPSRRSTTPPTTTPPPAAPTSAAGSGRRVGVVDADGAALRARRRARARWSSDHRRARRATREVRDDAACRSTSRPSS